MSIDIQHLRNLIEAEQQADLVQQANPGNDHALARSCNLAGSLTRAAVDALPELLDELGQLRLRFTEARQEADAALAETDELRKAIMSESKLTQLAVFELLTERRVRAEMPYLMAIAKAAGEWRDAACSNTLSCVTGTGVHGRLCGSRRLPVAARLIAAVDAARKAMKQQ